MKSFISLFFSFWLGFTALCSGQGLPDTLALEDLQELASQQALGQYQAQLNRESARLQLSVFKAGLKPQLSGFANFPNYSKTFSEITQPDGTVLFQPITNNNSGVGLLLTQDIPLTGGTVFLRSNLQRFDNFETNDRIYNGVPFRLGIIQPLFAFNPLKWDKRLEPLRLFEAEHQFIADREAIRVTATELFFNLLSAHQNLIIASSNVSTNEALAEIARERFELGKLSRRDLKQLELELVSARRNAVSARQSVQAATANIYAYLGLAYPGNLLVPEVPELRTDIALDAEQAVREARANHPDPISYTRRLLEAERDLAEVKGNGGLQAELVASFGLARSGQRPEDIYRDPQQEQLVQLQLNVPIVDWGRQRNSVARQKVQQELVQRQVAQDQLDFETRIQRLVVQLQELQREVELMEEVVQLAQEQFEITRESYVLGAVSITDLSLSQGFKDRNLRDYINTLGEYWNRYLELRSLTLYDFEQQQKIF